MKRLFLCLALALVTSAATAQIHWWGVVDFEARKGGKDSGLEKNELPNSYLQFNLQQFHLFIDADISPKISFSAKLANNPTKTLDYRTVELQLAYVTFSQLVGNSLSVSIGRILTPFGTFAQRQLPNDNPFIGQPLFISYTQNVSPQTGLLNPYSTYPSTASYGGRLTTLYCGGYFTGIEAAGSLVSGIWEYDVACMNGPLSSINGDYNMNDGLSFHGRTAFHPAIWATIGASYAIGSFMQPSSINQYFDQHSAPLKSFKQSTYGIDLRLSYLYAELQCEYISNHFDAPFLTYQESYLYESGYLFGLTRGLDSQEYLVDLKLEMPFYPGLFLAARYNPLFFNDILDPQATSPDGIHIRWNANVVRSALSFGYKPDRNVLVKLGYEWTAVDVQPAPDLGVWGCAVVVTFQ
jgi:hypothetical protein